MKFLTFITLFALASAHAQDIKPKALEDDFKLDPHLKKSESSDYQEKRVDDGKFFKVNSVEKLKIAKAKEYSDKTEVYQLKMKKIDGVLHKVESFVEMEKHPVGKVKSVTKCGMDGSKGGCQQYTRPFCQKMIDEEKHVNNKSIDWWKDLYKEKEVFETKREILTKISSMNRECKIDLGEELASDEYKSKFSPIYPGPNAYFDKEKIVKDISKCKEIIAEFKEESSPSNRATASERSVSEQ